MKNRKRSNDNEPTDHPADCSSFLEAHLHDTICRIRLSSWCMSLSVHACKRRFYATFVIKSETRIVLRSENYICQNNNRISRVVWMDLNKHLNNKSDRLIAVRKRSFKATFYTLRLIGPITYLGACYIRTKVTSDAFVRKWRCTFVGEPLNHIHQDTESARLIAVCKRSFR